MEPWRWVIERKLFLYSPTLATGTLIETHIFLSSPPTHLLLLIHTRPGTWLLWPYISFIHLPLHLRFGFGSKCVLRRVTKFYKTIRRHISIGSNSHSHSFWNLKPHSDDWFAYQLNNYQMTITKTVIWNPCISGQKWSSKKISLKFSPYDQPAKFERLCFTTVFSDCWCVFVQQNPP